MDAMRVIDVKLDEINDKIKRENINLKLTSKQCETMGKQLAKKRNLKK